MNGGFELTRLCCVGAVDSRHGGKVSANDSVDYRLRSFANLCMLRLVAGRLSRCHLADVSRHLNLMEANPANAETVNAATFNAVNDISTLDRQPELPASPCFTRASIASMAARQSVLARLLRKHANSQNNSAAKSHKIKKDPCADSWLVSLESLQADREAQKSAEQALRAHYAIWESSKRFQSSRRCFWRSIKLWPNNRQP